jgi:C4-type Zn-finger protein
MGEQRESTIERILHRIEDHVQEWRRQERARETEAAAQREALWAEAVEREKLLAQTITDEEAGRESIEEITKQHRVVFVVHSEEVAQTLGTFAAEKDRLVNVIPGRGSYGDGAGLKGSWLVFETQE